MEWNKINENLDWDSVYWDWLMTRILLNIFIDQSNAKSDKIYHAVEKHKYISYYDFIYKKINTAYSINDTMHSD